MKNLALFILLFLLGSINSFGQNLQNANWIFGFRDAINNNDLNSLNFNLNPSIMTSNHIYNNLEGCATVSDQTGNLLFTTNGVDVFGYDLGNNSFYLITNQLLGHISSTQNVIIVPKPKSNKRFYVFTINGFSSQQKGLYYTELDFSSGTGVVVAGTLNSQLYNYDGIPLNLDFNNLSEGITSTVHSDNETYWVITHVQNSLNNSGRIFCYMIT